MQKKTNSFTTIPKIPGQKAAFQFSEKDLNQITWLLACELKGGDRIFLEGPLGVGKSTFTYSLLRNLGASQAYYGSPSFPIAREYPLISKEFVVVHIDLFRIKNETDLEQTGIDSYLWDSGERNLVIAEWFSLWPTFFEQALHQPTVPCSTHWQINLNFIKNTTHERTIELIRS